MCSSDLGTKAAAASGTAKTVPWFQIGVPELKPHDLRHGLAMDVLEQHHGFEQMRALFGHTPIETT